MLQSRIVNLNKIW